jgi:hypothetical protein
MRNDVLAQTGRKDYARSRSDWLWTQLAMVAMTLLLLLAALLAFIFAILPPHTDGGDIGP